MIGCEKAPKGWKCTRSVGHEGPCAAVKVPWYSRLWNGIGNALGTAFEDRT